MVEGEDVHQGLGRQRHWGIETRVGSCQSWGRWRRGWAGMQVARKEEGMTCEINLQDRHRTEHKGELLEFITES